MSFLLGLVLGLALCWFVVGSFFVVLGGRRLTFGEAFRYVGIPFSIICAIAIYSILTV